MLKAAEAFHEAGYDVRHIYVEQAEWMIAEGRAIRPVCPWIHRPVHWHKTTGKRLFWLSRFRHFTFRAGCRFLPPRWLSLPLLVRATARVGPELIRAISEMPSDLIYGGTSNALGVVAEAADAVKTPFALDLEDFHTAEMPDNSQNRRAHALIGEIERRTLKRAAFLTTSSTPIADAYRERYGISPEVIHNVFRLPTKAPTFSPPADGVLRLIWFSQTIGPGRGLEEVIAAAGQLEQPIRIGLLGTPTEFSRSLVASAALAHPQLRVGLLSPRSPAEVLSECHRWDVGLAVEPGFSLNNLLATSNKLLTYPLAGLAIVATDTPGQREPAGEMAEGIFYYRPGDVRSLAEGLRRWAVDPDALVAAKRANWSAAVRRWHWDHPAEKGVLLAAVERSIGKLQPDPLALV